MLRWGFGSARGRRRVFRCGGYQLENFGLHLLQECFQLIYSNCYLTVFHTVFILSYLLHSDNKNAHIYQHYIYSSLAQKMDAVKFVPLLNYQEHGCTCNILSINNLNILLECGCPETLSNSAIASLFNEVLAYHLPQIHIALLSHDFVSHLGFIPMFAKIASKTRVILTTSPICKLGHLALYDFIYSRNLVEPFDLFSLEQVDSSFESMRTLKYKEKFIYDIPQQEGKENRIKFVPLPSGGSIGGVVWKITYKMLRILYVSRPYMKGEIISDGLALTELPKLADLVIMDSNVVKGFDQTREYKKAFKRLVQEQLEKNGNVIIPCDSGSRGLELVSSIKRFVEKYQEKLGPATKIYYMHTMSDRALEIARYHLEWMSSSVSQAESGKANETEFIEDKRLSCITSMQQFSQLGTEGGRVIFCTHSSLNYGLGYSLLQNYIEDPNTLFLFPFKPLGNTWSGHFAKGKTYEPVELKIPERIKVASPRKHSEVIKPELTHEPLPEIGRKESSNKLMQTKSMFKAKPFMCFEDSEHKKKIDEYGEMVTDQERKEWRKLNPSEESVNMLAESKRKLELSNAVITKLRKQEYSGIYTYNYKAVRAIPNCRFAFVNLEGINDRESLKLSIKYIQPKKVILFNGDQKFQKELKVRSAFKQ
eukprot:TRINITY_DN716_c0_g1_i1.p1 TRINITY_DN716_c0_g1~~TRINITY_DN716_c0_g1_i1.p1  ORF type:complete len:650 (-),score=49.42 TRINITY_DN716_c0_g1_i1:3972-5921(-)